MRALVLALALGPAQGVPPNGESFELSRNLQRSGRIEIRAPSGPAERAAERLLAALAEQGTLQGSLNPEHTDPSAVRVLVGAAADPALALLAARLGVEARPGGFSVLGREFLAAGDALVATLEDPEHAGLPLCLFLGNDLETVAAYLTEIPRLSRPFLRVYSDGDPALACPLERGGAPRAGEVVDYLARRTSYFDGAERLELPGLSVLARVPPDSERWASYAAQLGAARRRVTGWLGKTNEAAVETTVELLLYEHPEDLEACLGASELALANPLRPRVHVLLCEGLPDDGGRALARVLARALAGEPGHTWMWDGLTVAAADSWWGRPLDEWVTALAMAEIVPGVAELFASSTRVATSEHLLAPARGFLFKGLAVSSDGGRKMLALWKGAELPVEKVLPWLEAGLKRIRAGAREAPHSAKLRAERLAAAPVRQGLCLVEDAHTSYASRAVGPALESARECAPGTDALSLTVFAADEAPLPPTLALESRAVHGSASDLALANAAAEARARELRVLLALEVLASPGGSWAENVAPVGLADQPEFWRRMTSVVLHYAALAELLGLEIFSLGANLRDIARTEPRNPIDAELLEARRAGWRQVLGPARAVFRGGLTFSARFPGEAQEVGFWDQLDFVGLAFFPRLALPGRVPDEAEIRRLLRMELAEAIALGVRWGKPLLAVQVGFPARAGSWNKPALPRGASDPAAPARFYAALVDVLAGRLENDDALRGFYLWNWPVALPAEEARAAYSLRETPAAELLPRLFAR